MLFEKPVRFTGFEWNTLPAEENTRLDEAAKICKALAVSMVTRANSGHPAGALSSMKMYMAAYGASDITPENCDSPDRDYVVISHGHTSAAAYATLSYYGFVKPLEAVNEFRKTGSRFQGHVERLVPGIDWGSGCLGQGLSAACGFALGLKANHRDHHVYVVMGDGEQPKGQIAEARRMAIAHGLSNITALLDVNHIQISGHTEEVLPVNIKALWEADGWEVLTCDGGSFSELYTAMKQARESDKPVAILCETVMGDGVSFMENIPDYHGKAAGGDLYTKAMEELGQKNLVEIAAMHSHDKFSEPREVAPIEPVLETGEPRTYTAEDKSDNRGAFGKALAEVGALNYGKSDRTPILVFDCDLAGSVKTKDFSKACPEEFLQCGIQENSTATTAGAASAAGVVSVWADFGVFGLGEVYNQQRMNDINRTNEKLVLTHVGLDVGEDGMTHQCIDYVSLMSNFFGWKLIVPCDPNQTDRATRWALKTPGNICLAMGRSKLPTVITDGKPAFTGEFEYGKAVKVRAGNDAAIIALGCMTGRALAAAELLKEKGISASVYAVSSPLAIDEDALREAFATGSVVTVEDHNVNSGMGTIWTSRACEMGLSAHVSKMGVNRYGASGPGAEVYSDMGLDAGDIAARVESLKDKSTGSME